MADAPCNIQAEREILGAILLSEEHFWTAADELEPDAFFNVDHRAIFQAMANLAHASRQITVAAIQSRVSALDNGESPAAFLSALLHEAKRRADEGRGSYVAELAGDVAMLFSKRQAIQMAEKFLKKARDPGSLPLNILDDLIAETSDLVRSTDRIVERTSKQAAEAALKAAADARAGIPYGLRTGLVTLDEIMSGVTPGDLVLLGGNPGGGKTALAMQMAVHMAQFDHVGFFEMEMDDTKLFLRTLANMSGVPIKAMLNGVSDGQFSTISEAVSALGKRSLSIISNRRITINQIEARTRSMKNRLGTKVIIVDHLGLIKAGGRSGRGSDRVERNFDNAERLMELGKSTGVTIICLCHFTREARKREDPEPQMEDFYGGGIEQHADAMFATLNRHGWLDDHRPPNMGGKAGEHWLEQRRLSENKIEVHKMKDRLGERRAKRTLHWDGARTLFSDIIDVKKQQQELILGNDGDDFVADMAGF